MSYSLNRITKSCPVWHHGALRLHQIRINIMGYWDDIKELGWDDAPNFMNWVRGEPTAWDVPNFTTVRQPAFGGAYGWGADQNEKDTLNKWSQAALDDSAMSLGMGGTTRVVGSGPNKMIEAWHNTIPNTRVGQLGFMEGKGFNSLRDIKVDPQYRGQGYADELMNTFKNYGGQEPRFGGTITNSPGYWERLSSQMREAYPNFSKGLDTALDFARQDFGWYK
jgi:hypothetical protein